MAENTPSACVKIAACICGKDGVLSRVEELTLFEVLKEQFPSFKAEAFEEALTQFFDSNDQIEEYLSLIDDQSLREFTLKLAEVSAGADGLNVKENIALEKAYLIWGMKHHA